MASCDWATKLTSSQYVRRASGWRPAGGQRQAWVTGAVRGRVSESCDSGRHFGKLWWPMGCFGVSQGVSGCCCGDLVASRSCVGDLGFREAAMSLGGGGWPIWRRTRSGCSSGVSSVGSATARRSQAVSEKKVVECQSRGPSW